jgi:predicted nucleotidyltransferase
MAAKTNEVVHALRAAARDLRGIDARWALVGGLAVSARAEPRTTRDVDVAVATSSEAEAEETVFAMQQRGYSVRMLLEHGRRRRLATVRLVHRDRPRIFVDLLFASCGIETEIVEAAEMIEVVPRLRLPIARVGDLVAMKLLARDDRRRPQDADDLRHLLQVADAEDLSRARRSVRLIEARGFSRRRDLGAALTRLRRSWREAK